MNLLTLISLLLLPVEASGSSRKARQPEANAPEMPWVRRGVWVFSRVGRRMLPERLLGIAARHEAERRWYQAYYFYNRVVTDYRDAEITWAFSQAYLGMARCLNSVGKQVKAAEILLEVASPGDVLWGSVPARRLLCRLLEAKPVAEEKDLVECIRVALSRWPASPEKTDSLSQDGTSTGFATAGKRERGAEKSESRSDPRAVETFDKAEFYRRRGELEAAMVYYNCVIKDCPGSPEARKAERMLVLLKEPQED